MTTHREPKTSRSEMAGAVYEMISDAQDAGVVSAATLRSFEDNCIGRGRSACTKSAEVKAPRVKSAAAPKV